MEKQMLGRLLEEGVLRGSRAFQQPDAFVAKRVAVELLDHRQFTLGACQRLERLIFLITRGSSGEGALWLVFSWRGFLRPLVVINAAEHEQVVGRSTAPYYVHLINNRPRGWHDRQRVFLQQVGARLLPWQRGKRQLSQISIGGNQDCPLAIQMLLNWQPKLLA